MLFLALILGSEAKAQIYSTDVLTADTHAKPDTVTAGNAFSLGVTLLIEGGWHINSNAPLDEYLIPTEVTWDLPGGFEGGKFRYPADKRVSFAFSDKKLSVFDRKAEVSMAVAISGSTPGGLTTLKGSVRYQACNDEVCLPPKTEPVETTVYVVENPETESGGNR